MVLRYRKEENKMKKIHLDKNLMMDATQFIDADMDNPNIFKFVRKMQDDFLEQGAKITNAGELYIYLIDYKNSLSNDKKDKKIL